MKKKLLVLIALTFIFLLVGCASHEHIDIEKEVNSMTTFENALKIFEDNDYDVYINELDGSISSFSSKTDSEKKVLNYLKDISYETSEKLDTINHVVHLECFTKKEVSLHLYLDMSYKYITIYAMDMSLMLYSYSSERNYKIDEEVGKTIYSIAYDFYYGEE